MLIELILCLIEMALEVFFIIISFIIIVFGFLIMVPVLIIGAIIYFFATLTIETCKLIIYVLQPFEPKSKKIKEFSEKMKLWEKELRL